jgi:acyl-coenzyme A thioesterase PaaI-like protein
VTERERWRAASALADEMRRAIAALATNEVPRASLDRASELAAALCAELEGPPRPRWYDADSIPGTPSVEARSAYTAQSPIRGRLNPIAPPLHGNPVTQQDGSQAVVATARLGPAYEGPPHGVHGGWVAALFDDVLGQAQQLVRKAGVTATLKVRYRDITPLDEELRFTAWIHADQGRRVTARATCHAGDTLTADAEAIFIGVDFDAIRGRMRERRER